MASNDIIFPPRFMKIRSKTLELNNACRQMCAFISQQTRTTGVDNFKTLQILVYDCEANCSL